MKTYGVLHVEQRMQTLQANKAKSETTEVAEPQLQGALEGFGLRVED